MKVYIDGSWVAEPAFDDAAELLREQGHEVFRAGKDREGRQALADDLQWISLNADAIALFPGWERSSRVAFELARELDLQFIYL